MGRRVVTGVAIGALAAAAATVIAAGTLSVIVARTVIIPPSRRKEDVAILEVDEQAGTVLLSSNADSRLPGDYSFWFSGESGHARLGEILEQDMRTVRRRLLGVLAAVGEEPPDPRHLVAGAGPQFGRLQVGEVGYVHHSSWLVLVVGSATMPTLERPVKHAWTRG